MSDHTTTDSTMTDDAIEAIASEVESREFTPDELAEVRKTRRRSPRLGEARAEVYTFRAPPSYRARIARRAAADAITDSQVIRDALDAYLVPAATAPQRD